MLYWENIGRKIQNDQGPIFSQYGPEQAWPKIYITPQELPENL